MTDLPTCHWAQQQLEAIKAANGGRVPMVLGVAHRTQASKERGFPDPVPVSRFSKCGHSGCSDPVQFLSIDTSYVFALCEQHGHEVLERNCGMPVQFGEPLGRVVME